MKEESQIFREYIDYLENFHKSAHEITVKKAKDYTNSHNNETNDPMRNFVLSAEVAKIDVIQGIVNRMVDKLARLISLNERGTLEGDVGDKVVDDMKDLANYAGIAAYWIDNNLNSNEVADLKIEPDLNDNPTSEQIDRQLEDIEKQETNWFKKYMGM